MTATIPDQITTQLTCYLQPPQKDGIITFYCFFIYCHINLRLDLYDEYLRQWHRPIQCRLHSKRSSVDEHSKWLFEAGLSSSTVELNLIEKQVSNGRYRNRFWSSKTVRRPDLMLVLSTDQYILGLSLQIKNDTDTKNAQFRHIWRGTGTKPEIKTADWCGRFACEVKRFLHYYRVAHYSN